MMTEAPAAQTLAHSMEEPSEIQASTLLQLVHDLQQYPEKQNSPLSLDSLWDCYPMVLPATPSSMTPTTNTSFPLPHSPAGLTLSPPQTPFFAYSPVLSESGFSGQSLLKVDTSLPAINSGHLFSSSMWSPASAPIISTSFAASVPVSPADLSSLDFPPMMLPSFEIPSSPMTADAILNRDYNFEAAPSENPKPFRCAHSECLASFKRKHDLKRHERIHSGNRRFACQDCGKCFTRSDTLSAHRGGKAGAGCKAVNDRRKRRQFA
ncbi:MAG: hypothetical protein SGCHY_002075 [Lobulomycetales sp.]